MKVIRLKTFSDAAIVIESNFVIHLVTTEQSLR
jgi:hypothetical protein